MAISRQFWIPSLFTDSASIGFFSPMADRMEARCTMQSTWFSSTMRERDCLSRTSQYTNEPPNL